MAKTPVPGADELEFILRGGHKAAPPPVGLHAAELAPAAPASPPAAPAKAKKARPAKTPPAAPDAPKAPAEAPVKKTRSRPASAPPAAPARPWDNADRKAKQPFVAHLPDALNKKLNWLVDNLVGQHSKQKIVLRGIEELADRLIAEVDKRNGGAK